MSSRSERQSCDLGQPEHKIGTKRSDSLFRRSNMDQESMVPELHGGLLDLIRILGKLAHSASRTTIICEPFVPFHTSTKYHKNCNGSPAPIESSLKQLRNRPSSFWNPVQPKTYYYNCFNYQNVPARNEHYKEIDDKYELIKQNKLCYDPPECDDDHINKFLSDSGTGMKHRQHNARLLGNAETSGHQGPAKGKRTVHSDRPGEPTSKSTRPELSGVKSESKITKSESKGMKTDSKGMKTESKGMKTESKGMKIDSREKSRMTLLAENCNNQIPPNGDESLPSICSSESKLRPEGMKTESKGMKTESKGMKTESTGIKTESKGIKTESMEKSKRMLQAETCSNQIPPKTDDQSGSSIRSADSKSTCKLDVSSESGGEAQVCKLPKTSAGSKKSLGKSSKSTEDPNKSDVEELKEMIQRLENENLLRYQAMLNLMREMSTKDFCRATCDREMSSKDVCRATSAREMKEVKDCSLPGRVPAEETSISSGSDLATKSKKCARLDSDHATSSGPSLASGSNKSFKTPSGGSPKQASLSKLSVGNQDQLSKTTCFVGDAEMTLHDLMEMSSVIADVVVFETVKELMKRYMYRPPCEESKSKPFEKDEHGTFDSPFETAGSIKTGSSRKSAGSSKKTYGAPMPSGTSSGKNTVKSSVMEDASVSREPFVETQSKRGSSMSKPQISAVTETDGGSVKITISTKKVAPEEPSLERGSTFSDRSKTLDRNKLPQVQPVVSSTPKSEILKSDNSASESRRNPDCPKHGTSPRGSSAGSSRYDTAPPTKPEGRLSPCADERPPNPSYADRPKSHPQDYTTGYAPGGDEMRQSVKSTCRKYDSAPPTKPEGRLSPCADGRPPKPSYAESPKSHPQDYTTGSLSGSDEMRQSVKSTCRKFDTTPSTKPELRPSPCADRQQTKPGPKSPSHDISSDNNDGTVLYFTKTTKNAFPPQKDSPNAAGFMLRSAYDYNLQPKSIISVKTDLTVELPPNSYGRLAPRNCLTKNFGINVIGDVIDHDYDDTVTVVVINHSDTEVPIKRGAKIAQLICERIYQPRLQEKKE